MPIKQNTAYDNLLNQVQRPDTPNVLPNGVQSSGVFDQNQLDELSKSALQIYNRDNSDSYQSVTSISPTLIDKSGRYPMQLIGQNNEELYGQGQSALSKYYNGLLKGVALAGTTFIEGTAGLLYGTASALKDGKFSSYYDNPLTRSLDELNQSLETKYLPNYYTEAENNGNILHNLGTANFWSDKVLKNLGMIAGAVASGEAWGSVVGLIGKGAKAVAAGKALQTVEQTEAATAAALSNGRAATAIGDLEKSYSALSKAYNPTSAAQKALVSGLNAAGQSTVFGLQTANEVKRNLIQNFIDENGYEPYGADLAAINARADRAGSVSFGLNAGIFMAMNYIHLPRIAGSVAKLEEGAAKPMERLKVNPTTGLFEKVQPSKLVAKAQGLTRRLGGFRLSPTGAIQWGALGIVPHSVDSYYSKMNNKDGNDAIEALWDSVTDGLSSKEGLEQFLLGAIGEGLMEGPISKLRNVARRRRGLEPIGLNAERARRAANTEEFLRNQGTSVHQFMKESIEGIKRGMELQSDREQALADGDIQTAKDREGDFLINFFTPKIKYGLFDEAKNSLMDLHRQAQTDEGFQSLQDQGIAHKDDNKFAFISRVEKAVALGENLNTAVKALQTRYGNVMDEDAGGNLTRRYDDDVINKMAYEHAKIFEYDRRIKEISSDLLSAGINAEEALRFDKSQDNYDNLNKVEAQIDANDNLFPEQKENLKTLISDGITLGLKKTEAFGEYADLLNNPNKYKEVAKETPKEPTTVVDGEELATGTEFTTENGMKITINAENSDGTLNITDSEGNTRNITKKELKDLKPFEPTTDPTDLFFTEHGQEPFTIRMGSKEYEGKLIYDKANKKLSFEYQDGEETVRIPATNSMFKGENPLIRANNPEVAQSPSLANLGAAGDLSADAFEVIQRVSKDYRQSLDNINKTIGSKRQEITNIQHQIDAHQKVLDSTGKIQGKKALLETLGATSRLVDTHRKLSNELSELESQRDRLQFQKEYLESQVIPEEYTAFRERFNKQKEINEDLILDNAMQIPKIQKLLTRVKNTIEVAHTQIRNLTGQISRLTPYTEAVLTEARNLPGFDEAFPNYDAQLKSIRTTIESIENVTLNPSKRLFKDLTEQLSQLQAELAGAEKVSKVHEDVERKIKEYEQEQQKQQEKVETEVQQEAAPEESAPVEVQNSVLAAPPEGDIIVPDEVAEGFEDAKKPLERWKGSTTKATKETKPHQVRESTLYNKLDNHPDRQAFKRIKVTRANERALGLEGIIDRQLGSYKPSTEDTEPVLVVYIKEVGGKDFYIDKNGEVIGKVPETGEAVTNQNLDNIVWGILASPRLEQAAEYGGGPIYSRGTPERASELQAEYRAERKRTLNLSTGYEKEAFFTSTGIPKSDRIPKSVTENFITKEILDSKKNVIHLSNRNETRTLRNGDKVSTRKDVAYLVDGDRTIKLHKRKFAVKDYTKFRQTLENLAEGYAKTGELNKDLTRYLGGVLFMHRPGEGQISTNQFYIDAKTGELVLGKNRIPFTPEGVESNRSTIQKFFKGAELNINRAMLADNQPFKEITAMKNGEPVFKDWPSYQHFLLSGEGRTGTDIPLYTDVVAGTDFYRSRYSWPVETSRIVQLKEPKPTDLNLGDIPTEKVKFDECNG